MFISSFKNSWSFVISCFCIMTGMRVKPPTPATDLPYLIFCGEAELRERLGVLRVAVEGRVVETEMRRVVETAAGPDTLGGWLRDVAEVLSEAFVETVDDEDRREARLAAIDQRRIEILTAQ